MGVNKRKKADKVKPGKLHGDSSTKADPNGHMMKPLVAEPQKFTRERQEEYFELLRLGMRRTAAAKQVDISRVTIGRYRNTNSEFYKAEREAEREANELVEDALFQAAVSGNVVAIQVWLYNRAPDRWADKRQAHLTYSQESEVDREIREMVRKIQELPSGTELDPVDAEIVED